MTMMYLISNHGESNISGIDIALLDDVKALQAADVKEWMAMQGYSESSPDEYVILAEEPPGTLPALDDENPNSGLPVLPVELDDDDMAAWRTAAGIA